LLNKKGVDFATVGKLIFGLLVLYILFNIFAYGYPNFIIEEGSKESCKNWVNLQSTPLLKERNTFESPCITTQIEIKKEKTKDEIYKTLANNIYDCWDQYGRGESDFYSDFDWGSSDNYCRICSEIKINEDLNQNLRNIDLDDFEIYLSNNHPPGNDNTYAEFFTKAENANIDFGSGTLNLDPKKSIYSSFVVYKSSKANDFQEWGFAAGGCVAGGVIVGSVAGLFTAGPGAIPGYALGCKIGFVAGTATGLFGFKDYLYPSITLFQSDSADIKDSCDYVYYKPVNDRFSGGGGEFGGGGSSGSF